MDITFLLKVHLVPWTSSPTIVVGRTHLSGYPAQAPIVPPPLSLLPPLGTYSLAAMRFFRRLSCMAAARDLLHLHVHVEPPVCSPDPEALERLYHRNAVQPICRLPPEIFVIIFLYTQHENNAYFTVEFFSSYKPRWLRVMLGCRYFRDVAVHAPVLWSAYHCLSPKAYRELCLQRSADSILRICIGEGTIAEIAPHAHRVHAAALSYEALEIALDIPMPQLQWLEVTALGAHQFILSSSSFGRTAARLTHLHLFGRSIVLCEHPPRLPELRQLKLDSFRTWRNPRRMVALLASAPSLEVLSVAHLLVDFSSLIMALPITIPEPVTLPRLKTLQIVQSDFETAFLLRLIPMPSFALSDSLQSSEPHVNVPLHLGTYHTKSAPHLLGARTSPSVCKRGFRNLVVCCRTKLAASSSLAVHIT
jgi:hypothetical protein